MKKVLVVDDTKNIRILLTTFLELEGYEVFSANDGYQALDLIKSKKLDLVFLDIKLPELSGTEVLRRIRNLGINVPVVIMTAFATVKNAVDCTKMGAVAYLQKPFTTDKVKVVLGEIWASNNDTAYDIDIYINSSKEFISAGKLDNAYDLLKNALSINPSCSEVYYLIGKVYDMKGDIKEASKFYEVSKQFE